MASEPNPIDDPADAAALAAHGATLVAAVDAALPGWVLRAVQARWVDWSGQAAPASLVAEATKAGESAREEVTTELASLLALDVDAQRANPLAVIRLAVAHATQVLAAAGVPPVERDRDAVRIFPDDVYDLVPGSFGDIDDATREAGLTWGAAKAHVILARRRGPSDDPRPT